MNPLNWIRGGVSQGFDAAMRGISMEGFAPNNGPCPRKRGASLNPLPPFKRHCKLSIFSQQVINVEDVDENDFIAKKNDPLTEDVHTVGDEPVNFQDILSALPGKEKPDSYPFVVYEGDVAIVKLGVGQKVMLDGCAMVQVVEGQASMLGYSFPRGTDLLVCSSPENGELSIIEAQHGGVVLESMDVEMADGSCGETRRTLACQLRIASHTLGHNVLAPQKGLSFQLEFVPSPAGGSRGKKRGRQFVDEEFRGIKRTGRPG